MEIPLPPANPFLLFLPFLRDLKHAGWLDLFRRAKPFLLFLLFLRDNYYLMRIVALLSRFLLSHGNKGNKGNLHPPRRSHFCYFCHFCGTIIISCGKLYCPKEMKEVKEIQVSDVALGRPSTPILQGKELPRPT